MKWIGLLAALWTLQGWALDIDEKLTLRILKLSKTKKTILINRGVEDGLKVGDHAKFYLTTGMIARGVVVKTSPARSAWSLYRLIDPSLLVKDKVVNLKVATPIKISPDPSKMIMVEPVAVPGSDIPLSPDAESLAMAARSGDEEESEAFSDEKELGAFSDEEELGALEGDGKTQSFPSGGSSIAKTWEVMGHGHLSYLASALESKSSGPNSDTTEESGSEGSYDLSFGIEKYFAGSRRWYERFSFQTFFRLGKNGVIDVNGGTLSNTFWGLGIGLSYHFSHYPKEVGKPIIYGIGSFGLGKVKNHHKVKKDLEGSEGNGFGPTNLDGAVGFSSIGLGVKYYLGRWGSKMEVNYDRRVERYTIEDDSSENEVEKIKVLNGGNFLLGILYRF